MTPDKTPEITPQVDAGATLTPETSQDTKMDGIKPKQPIGHTKDGIPIFAVEPPPTPRRKHMKVGMEIMNFFDAMGVPLTPEFREKCAAIIDDKGMCELIESEMADCMKIDAAAGRTVFQNLLMPKVQIPEMLMTFRFYTIWSAMQCVEWAKRLIKGGDDVDPPTYEQQIDGIRAWTEAVKAMNMLVHQAQKLAEAAGYMKKSKNEKPPKPTRNAPPED